MRYFPCDFFIMQGSNVLSDWIMHATDKEVGMSFSHALIAITEGNDPAVVEAVFPRVRVTPLSHALRQARYTICLRPLGWTDEQKACAIKEALAHVNELYGVDNFAAKIPSALLDREAILARHLSQRYVDCAELAGRCIEQAGGTFGKSAFQLAPNDLNYYARSHPDLFDRFLVPMQFS